MIYLLALLAAYLLLSETLVSKADDWRDTLYINGAKRRCCTGLKYFFLPGAYVFVLGLLGCSAITSRSDRS